VPLVMLLEGVPPPPGAESVDFRGVDGDIPVAGAGAVVVVGAVVIGRRGEDGVLTPSPCIARGGLLLLLAPSAGSNISTRLLLLNSSNLHSVVA
jgi:hypothetical protein